MGLFSNLKFDSMDALLVDHCKTCMMLSNA